MWDLPGPGFEPVSPALAGRFLTTAPPGKSITQNIFFKVKLNVQICITHLPDRSRARERGASGSCLCIISVSCAYFFSFPFCLLAILLLVCFCLRGWAEEIKGRKKVQVLSTFTCDSSPWRLTPKNHTKLAVLHLHLPASLEMRKLRFREGKRLLQSHIALKG